MDWLRNEEDTAEDVKLLTGLFRRGPKQKLTENGAAPVQIYDMIFSLQANLKRSHAGLGAVQIAEPCRTRNVFHRLLALIHSCKHTPVR